MPARNIQTTPGMRWLCSSVSAHSLTAHSDCPAVGPGGWEGPSGSRQGLGGVPSVAIHDPSRSGGSGRKGLRCALLRYIKTPSLPRCQLALSLLPQTTKSTQISFIRTSVRVPKHARLTGTQPTNSSSFDRAFGLRSLHRQNVLQPPEQVRALPYASPFRPFSSPDTRMSDISQRPSPVRRSPLLGRPRKCSGLGLDPLRSSR
jgi:hypothetical protein